MRYATRNNAFNPACTYLSGASRGAYAINLAVLALVAVVLVGALAFFLMVGLLWIAVLKVLLVIFCANGVALGPSQPTANLPARGHSDRLAADILRLTPPQPCVSRHPPAARAIITLPVFSPCHASFTA